MLEFKILQELKPNTEILEIIKDYTYETKNGNVKHIINTNLQSHKFVCGKNPKSSTFFV